MNAYEGKFDAFLFHPVVNLSKHGWLISQEEEVESKSLRFLKSLAFFPFLSLDIFQIFIRLNVLNTPPLRVGLKNEHGASVSAVHENHGWHRRWNLDPDTRCTTYFAAAVSWLVGEHVVINFRDWWLPGDESAAVVDFAGCQVQGRIHGCKDRRGANFNKQRSQHWQEADVSIACLYVEFSYNVSNKLQKYLHPFCSSFISFWCISFSACPNNANRQNHT